MEIDNSYQQILPWPIHNKIVGLLVKYDGMKSVKYLSLVSTHYFKYTSHQFTGLLRIRGLFNLSEYYTHLTNQYCVMKSIKDLAFNDPILQPNNHYTMNINSSNNKNNNYDDHDKHTLVNMTGVPQEWILNFFGNIKSLSISLSEPCDDNGVYYKVGQSRSFLPLFKSLKYYSMHCAEGINPRGSQYFKQLNHQLPYKEISYFKGDLDYQEFIDFIGNESVQSIESLDIGYICHWQNEEQQLLLEYLSSQPEKLNQLKSLKFWLETGDVEFMESLYQILGSKYKQIKDLHIEGTLPDVSGALIKYLELKDTDLISMDFDEYDEEDLERDNRIMKAICKRTWSSLSIPRSFLEYENIDDGKLKLNTKVLFVHANPLELVYWQIFDPVSDISHIFKSHLHLEEINDMVPLLRENKIKKLEKLLCSLDSIRLIVENNNSITSINIIKGDYDSLIDILDYLSETISQHQIEYIEISFQDLCMSPSQVGQYTLLDRYSLNTIYKRNTI